MVENFVFLTTRGQYHHFLINVYDLFRFLCMLTYCIFIHSTSVSFFFFIRVQCTLGVREEYNVDLTPVHRKAPCTPTVGAIKSPPTGRFFWELAFCPCKNLTYSSHFMCSEAKCQMALCSLRRV